MGLDAKGKGVGHVGSEWVGGWMESPFERSLRNFFPGDLFCGEAASWASAAKKGDGVGGEVGGVRLDG